MQEKLIILYSVQYVIYCCICSNCDKLADILIIFGTVHTIFQISPFSYQSWYPQKRIYCIVYMSWDVALVLELYCSVATVLYTGFLKAKLRNWVWPTVTK